MPCKDKAAAARYQRIHRAKYPEKTHLQMRRYQLLHHYGITPEQREVMLGLQGGCCAVCRKPPSRKRLNVDHDHVTGVVRGLLCGDCNRALGLLRENVTTCRNMIDYLEKYARTTKTTLAGKPAGVV